MARARRGCQTPTYSFCDSYSRTEGRMAVELTNAYGLPPHEWQQLILNDWLALDDNGLLLNTFCLLDVPRQNGKTGVCDPRETWGLIKRGEWILHTAQEYQTAKKAFDRLREKFGNRKNDPLAKYPELNRMVERYTTSANQMVLDLTNDAHIEFRTRGNKDDMGRGGTFDLIVIDEAQAYTDEQDASLSPLNSAAPHGSPQTIMMGTSPDPKRAGENPFSRMRDTLHESPYTGACIHEWGSNEKPLDVFDRDAWFERNPSLGYQLLVSAFEKDVRSMTADKFAMEHLGWHPQELTKSVKPINANAWDRCKTDAPDMDGIAVFAVKFSPDGSRGSLCVGIKHDNGTVYIELVKYFDMSDGLGWLVDWLDTRQNDVAEIYIDGQSNAQTLCERLLDRGVSKMQITRPATRDVVAACSSLANAVKECNVTHFGQEELTRAATQCPKRRIGTSGGWGFESTDDADASIIEAAALAYRGATTTKRDQRRELLIG